MAYENFEYLDTWKKARLLKMAVREVVKSFPSVEKYRLVDQLIRSSRSVGTQLAEGHGRRTDKEKLRYSIFSRGSLSETLNHLIDAFDEGYITSKILQEFRIQIAEVERLLTGYIKYLENKLNGF